MMSEEKNTPEAVEQEPLTETEINEQMQFRLNKMNQLSELGLEPFGRKFDWTHHAQDIADNFEELTEKETVVRLAGRVMAIRGMARQLFWTCLIRQAAFSCMYVRMLWARKIME